MAFEVTQMQLEKLTQSEVCQKERQTPYDTTYVVESKMWHK